MRKVFLILLTTILVVPIAARADFDVDDLPNAATWYLHVDLEQMRSAESSRQLYGWFREEVLEDIHDETGLDVNREINQITAYSAADGAPVILIEGPVSPESIESLLEMAEDEGDLARFKTQGMEYIQLEKHHRYRGDKVDIDFDDLDHGAYVSFALRDKIIVTPSRELMESMLMNNGRIPGQRSHSDALFVLSAERNLVQAGANAKRLSRHGDWDSKLLRNTRQVALLIADSDGRIAVDARLQATEASMANSLANVARGLIGLASFSDDMEPHIASLLRSTRIDVEDDVLKFSVAMDPNDLVAILED